MPERASPKEPYPTPASVPISSNRPLPRLANKKFATVSFPTKRSIHPSLLMSAATTPQALANDFAIPDSLLTSVNVPSPLLRNSQHGAGLYTFGLQYQRRLADP